jgi:hypothetical protein
MIITNISTTVNDVEQCVYQNKNILNIKIYNLKKIVIFCKGLRKELARSLKSQESGQTMQFLDIFIYRCINISIIFILITLTHREL